MDNSPRPPRFLYFDLGNVLLRFDHARACRSLAALTSLPDERIRDVIFTGGLNAQLDAGTLTSAEFHERVCQALGCRLGFDEFALAINDIFEVDPPVTAVIGKLSAAGHRLGLISNTCELHWKFISDGRYGLIPTAFEQVVLSYELRQMKPQPEIYLEAARRAGVEPQDVFYTDDLAENVAGAKAAGFDAVLFTTPLALAEDLRKRGVRFNY